MGISWTSCPRCGGRLDRSDRIIPDIVIIRCAPCRRYMLADDDRWYEAPTHDEVLTLLSARHEAMIRDEQRHIDLIESDISDPRWN